MYEKVSQEKPEEAANKATWEMMLEGRWLTATGGRLMQRVKRTLHLNSLNGQLYNSFEVICKQHI